MDLRPNHQFDPFDSDDDPRLPLPDEMFKNIDFNDPASFFKALGGGSGTNLPIPKEMSPEEVRGKARGSSDAILRQLDILHEILERHEATIQNRWMKKTKQQRCRILLNAWPDLPASHRPDFEAFRKETPQQREAGTRYRNAFIWPYMNQEDLSKPRILLLLLNARARNHPSYFAAADGEAMHLGKVTQGVVPIFLNCYVVTLNGLSDRKVDADYGKLVHWDDHPDAFSWMHTRRQFLPGEALLILEAQERLMVFLTECCKQILHDIPTDSLISDSYPIQPEPPSKSENNVTGHTSLAVMAAETPYRLPSSLDISRLVSLLSANAASKEDHIWSLREDPGYFHQCVLEASQHRQEILNDIDGRTHPVFQLHREDVFWHRVTGEIVANSYVGLESFSELSRQAQDLHNLQSTYNLQISPDRDLPEKYTDALLKFRFYLQQLAKGPLSLLKGAVTASPPFRPFFVRLPPDDPNSPLISIQSNGRKMAPLETQLMWLLQTLWEDSRSLFLCGMPLIVDELQRLIDMEPKAKTMITEYVGNLIGDLAIICECLRQLDTYQPWASSFETQSVDREEGIKAQYAKSSQPWARILGALKNPSDSMMGSTGCPSDKKFGYPVWKRRTKENTDIMRQSEANLDAFWSQVDKLMFKKAGDLTGTAVRKLLTQPRILQRTAQWSEPVKPNVKPSSRHGPSEDSATSLIKPLSEIYFDHESCTSRKTASSTAPRPKSKVKTRGASESNRSSHTAEAEPNPADPQPTFAVDSRALKVFRTVFFMPSLTAVPGEVAWNDFVHAMISTGFGAEKLYGSVWHFTPSKLHVERSIQFHEPHPSGKIPFRIARRHGRRLHRAYGWHGGMFVLQEKAVA
jgi:hypothetical protein